MMTHGGSTRDIRPLTKLGGDTPFSSQITFCVLVHVGFRNSSSGIPFLSVSQFSSVVLAASNIGQQLPINERDVGSTVIIVLIFALRVQSSHWNPNTELAKPTVTTRHE